MNDPVAVQIVESVHQLLGNFADLCLTKVAVILKDLE